MPTRIAGFVLRAQDKAVSANFYDRLGLTLREHEHGGPMHFEMGPNAPELVFELYQSSPRYPGDALMIEVDSLEEALAVCREFGIVPAGAAREQKSTRFIYVDDPDGRSLMLAELKR